MNPADLAARLLPGLVVGTARQQPDFAGPTGGVIEAGDPKAGLKALALTAQALRFARTAAPTTFAAGPVVPRSRTIVPEALRPAIVRLLGDGKGALSANDDLALAVAIALERHRLQPHPFDFHRMEAFLRAHAERLGPEVCLWVDRDKSVEEKRGFLDPSVLDDADWHEATPARRQRFIEDRRRSDPERARALVEAVWAKEGADLRFRLLQALRTGLSPADQPFLEALAKDRAPRVRERAARYLGLLPGSGHENPALRHLVGRIVRGHAGLLRRRPTLRLDIPATVSNHGWRDWLAEAFAEVETAELSAILALSPAEMLAAAEGDRPLATLLALLAVREGDVAQAERALDALHDFGPTTDHALFAALDVTPEAARQKIAEILLRRAVRAAEPIGLALATVFRLTGSPLATELAARILDTPEWGTLAPSPSHHVLAGIQALAALTPPALRPRLRAALAAVDLEHVMPVFAALDILDHLEEVPAHD